MKKRQPEGRTRKSKLAGSALAIGGAVSLAGPACADEGGVSFWLPGIYGSLPAAPMQPGVSFTSIYYHITVSASGATAAARELTIGRFDPSATVDLNVKLNADANLLLLNPSYVFAPPVLGGQLAIGMMGIAGVNDTGLSGTLTTPIGGLSTTRKGSIADSITGFGDLYPQISLRWNSGVNNFMTYLTGDIPVGAHDSSRLSNLGTGHGAVDGGLGYTYFNPETSHEFSAVTGLTYNLVNPSTNYQNGLDWHLDWGASQFLSKTSLIGAVGYFYEQLTADRGAAQILGAFESRVIGIGPQIGFIIPIGTEQGYLNFKAYKEFASHARPGGWNAWVTFSISPAPHAPTPLPVVAKY